MTLPDAAPPLRVPRVRKSIVVVLIASLLLVIAIQAFHVYVLKDTVRMFQDAMRPPAATEQSPQRRE